MSILLRGLTTALAAAALWTAPATVIAQGAVTCPCDHITITADAALACNATICYQLSPLGPVLCETVTPGGRISIPCPVYSVTLTLCNGGSVTIIGTGGPLPAIGVCSGVVRPARDCCARVCRGPNDAAGCPVIEIRAVPCPSPGC